ncbi:MAG: hypothetical protein ACLUDQ_00075 [Bilophila wadsworthia]
MCSMSAAGMIWLMWTEPCGEGMPRMAQAFWLMDFRSPSWFTTISPSSSSSMIAACSLSSSRRQTCSVMAWAAASTMPRVWW